MTKKEAFLEVVQVGSISDRAAEVYLKAKGIVLDAEFMGNLDELELAAIPLLQSLLSVSSAAEGEFSEGRSREGIKDRLLFIARKHGLEALLNVEFSKPVIQAYNWGL